MRALEAEKPLADRSQEQLYQLVEAEVLKPQVAASWTLLDSLFKRDEIMAQVAALPGNVDLQFHSWVNWNFVSSPQSADPLKAGISTAIWGSLWVTLISFLVAIPLGTAAAIYLEEYSSGRSKLDQVIETNINNLAGVPSIIYGMLGLAVFVRFFGADHQRSCLWLWRPGHFQRPHDLVRRPDVGAADPAAGDHQRA